MSTDFENNIDSIIESIQASDKADVQYDKLCQVLKENKVDVSPKRLNEALTHKDFNFIAEGLKNATSVDDVTEGLIPWFKSQNPKFDEQRFSAAIKESKGVDTLTANEAKAKADSEKKAVNEDLETEEMAMAAAASDEDAAGVGDDDPDAAFKAETTDKAELMAQAAADFVSLSRLLKSASTTDSVVDTSVAWLESQNVDFDEEAFRADMLSAMEGEDAADINVDDPDVEVLPEPGDNKEVV